MSKTDAQTWMCIFMFCCQLISGKFRYLLKCDSSVPKDKKRLVIADTGTRQRPNQVPFETQLQR